MPRIVARNESEAMSDDATSSPMALTGVDSERILKIAAVFNEAIKMLYQDPDFKPTGVEIYAALGFSFLGYGLSMGIPEAVAIMNLEQAIPQLAPMLDKFRAARTSFLELARVQGWKI